MEKDINIRTKTVLAGGGKEGHCPTGRESIDAPIQGDAMRESPSYTLKKETK